MAYNPFLGRSREWLEAQLAAAQEDMAGGSSISHAEAGDARTDARVDKSPDARVKLLLRALRVIAPNEYAQADVTPIDRTRVTFWNQPTPVVSQ